MKRTHIYLSLAISLILVLSLFLMGAGGCPSERYKLTINVSPAASGSVSPEGGNYDPGVTVTVTATANSGYSFDHWGGDASGSDPTITVVMDADKEITANFIAEGYEVLFSDDFSDPASGWATFDTSEGRVSYQDGAFYIKDIIVDGLPVFSGVAYPLTDFTLEVETWLVDGSDDNFHQVACRFQDENNFYMFSISADGYYAIDNIVGGEQITLDSGYSGDINQGVGAVNLMYIECIGSSLSLSANGHLLAAVSDGTFSSGYLLLAGNVLSDDFTEVAFDNLVVYVPAGYTGGGETGGGDTDSGDTGGGETEWTLLFSDDFTDASNGWAIFDEPQGQVSCPSYLDIKDYATDDTPTYSGLAYPLTDFALEVKTWLADGTDDNWQGVLCRYQDADNYYIFAVSADGYYYIAKFVNGEEIPLGGDYSTDVYYGTGTTNNIRIECVGSSLSLSANGSVLATVTDTSFSDGYLALAAWALADDFTEVAFDNLEVYGPATDGGGDTGGGDTGGGDTVGDTGGVGTEEILLTDDFSDPSSGWDVYSDMGGEVTYKNGELHLTDFTDIPAHTETILYDHYFDDFSLVVETRLVAGHPDNWHKVICRWQDHNNYYIFAISADGYYAISKVVNGTETLLATYSSPSIYINQGTGVVNTIIIVCISSNLSLYVNDYLMDTVIDSTFYGGYIGFAADALDGTSTHIAFDNLFVGEEERS